MFSLSMESALYRLRLTSSGPPWRNKRRSHGTTSSEGSRNPMITALESPLSRPVSASSMSAIQRTRLCSLRLRYWPNSYSTARLELLVAEAIEYLLTILEDLDMKIKFSRGVQGSTVARGVFMQAGPMRLNIGDRDRSEGLGATESVALVEQLKKGSDLGILREGSCTIVLLPTS